MVETLEIAQEEDEEDHLLLTGSVHSAGSVHRTSASFGSHKSRSSKSVNAVSNYSMSRWLGPVSLVGLLVIVWFVFASSEEEIDIRGDVQDKVPTPTTGSYSEIENNEDSTLVAPSSAVVKATPSPIVSPQKVTTAPPTSLPTTQPPVQTQPPTLAPVEPVPAVVAPIVPDSGGEDSGGGSSATGSAASVVTVDGLWNNYQTARQQFWNQIQTDYGEFADALFLYKNGGETNETVSMGRLALGAPVQDGINSRDDFVRRVALKLLSRLIPDDDDDDTNNSNGNAQFMWATGGHSATAGHGDYFNESYTYVMGERLRDVFAAVDVDFKVRPYAMGGTGSGPEIAACAASVYGRDIDVLSWDTGMTDGNRYDAMGYYLAHAHFTIPTRPLGAVFHTGTRMPRLGAIRDLQEMGLSIVWHNETWAKYVFDQMPDTEGGLTQEQIDALPRLVRYFRCGKQIEKGDLCADDKFNTQTCKKRKFMVSWHPGFKWHALEGTIYSLFMADVLEDALLMIRDRADDLPVLQLELTTAADAQFEKAKNWESWPNWFSALVTARTKVPFELDEDLPMDMKTLLQSNNLCHTARLPSEIRYSGVLTEQPDRQGLDNFYWGIPHTEGRPIAASNQTEMRLAYASGERQKCDDVLNIDYKDYYVVGQEDGWQEITLPNDSEVATYELENLQGYIGICFVGCAWGKCPHNVYNDEAINGRAADEKRELDLVEPGQGEIEVNGQKVTHLNNWYNECQFLKHADGHQFAPNSDGKWVIRARMLAEKKMFRFSSFLIW